MAAAVHGAHARVHGHVAARDLVRQDLFLRRAARQRHAVGQAVALAARPDAAHATEDRDGVVAGRDALDRGPPVVRVRPCSRRIDFLPRAFAPRPAKNATPDQYQFLSNYSLFLRGWPNRTSTKNLQPNHGLISAGLQARSANENLLPLIVCINIADRYD